MEIIRSIVRMKRIAQRARSDGAVLGLVPTMGALHEGHFSLVRSAQDRGSSVVVSIFVNPRQFGPNEDLEKYPRSFESDCAALESLGVDYVFAPTPEEMYPEEFRTSVQVEGLSNKLEGRSRPDHFRGVTTVVLKLFEIVQPSFACFGRKDAQQLRIVEQMVADLNLSITIVSCPIVRSPDGLALSSRNAYLLAQERQAATVLYRALDRARRKIEAGERNVVPLIREVRETLAEKDLVTVDYAEIVAERIFEPVEQLKENCLLLVAALVGSTRLIDNARIEQRGDSFEVTV